MHNTLFITDDMVQSERYLHTPSGFAKQNLLYVQEIGYSESKQPHRCIRENVNSYLFMIVMDGKGSIDIGDTHYDIKRGDCAFINCKEHFEHISSSTDAWKLAWVHFNGEIVQSYYDLFLTNNAGNVFHVDNIEEWIIYISKLIEKQNDKRFSAELQSGELLLSLVNNIVTAVSDYRLEEKELTNKIRIYLNNKYNKPDVMDMLVHDLKIDKDTLNKTFFRYYGISIEEYVAKRRFNVAKQLLRFSIKSVKDILIESGISNYQDMQKQFEEEEGMTAEEYRRRWAQWIRQ